MILRSRPYAILTNEDDIGSSVDTLSGLSLRMKRYTVSGGTLAHAPVSITASRLRLLEKIKGIKLRLLLTSKVTLISFSFWVFFVLLLA